MNKRINALETQLKIQKENLNKMSTLANKKEEKLNNDISQYQKQINDVIKHNGFGDKALLQRCKSKFHWAVYKSMTKLKVWR